MINITNIESQSFAKRFEHHVRLLSSKAFLHMEGLGNEIPFYISPFPVQKTNQMYRDVEDLKKHLHSKQVNVLHISLYQLALDLLNERLIMDKIFALEPTLIKADLFEQLENVLQPEKHLVPALERYLIESDYQILFITGIGEVFPYIRTSTLLECMQGIKHKKPVVFFYPGEYDVDNENGSMLRLFGVMDEKHYRAYNIFHCLPNLGGIN